MERGILEIAPQTTLIDVKHLDTEEVIASALLESAGRLALIDPGPTSRVGNLEAGLGALGLSVAILIRLKGIVIGGLGGLFYAKSVLEGGKRDQYVPA